MAFDPGVVIDQAVEDAFVLLAEAVLSNGRLARSFKHAWCVEVVCSRCRSVLASGARLADATVLHGSEMGAPTLPAGVVVVDPAAVTVQVHERGRPMF